MTISHLNSLQQLMDGMLAFVGIFSRDGRLLEANRSALGAGDESPEEVYGKHVSEIEELRPIVDALNTRLAGRKGCFEAVAQAPTGPGSPRVFVGTSDSEFAPPEAHARRLPTDRLAPMVLHVERPRAGWQQQVWESFKIFPAQPAGFMNFEEAIQPCTTAATPSV